jgi:hypothetical protein
MKETRRRLDRLGLGILAEFVVQALESDSDPPPEAGFAGREAPKHKNGGRSRRNAGSAHV